MRYLHRFRRVSWLFHPLFLLLAWDAACLGQDRLFATANGFGLIEINVDTGQLINVFETPEFNGVGDGLAFDGESLYYLNSGVESLIYKMDPDSGNVLDTIELPDTGFNMYGQGLAHLDGRLYILDWSAVNQDIVVYDIEQSQFVDTLDFNGANPGAPIVGGALGAITGPDALLLSSFQGGETSIFEVDPFTGSILNTFDWGVNSALGLTSLGDRILVGDHVAPGMPFRDHILVFDREGNQVDSITITTSDRRSVLGVQSLAGSGEGVVSLRGDFNGDDLLTAADINLLSQAVRVGQDLAFDLNRDRALTREDRRIWIEDIKKTIVGDVDLDGTVQFSDFLVLSNSFGTLGGWGHGDLDGNGDVGFADFLLLSGSFGQTAQGIASVPEPSTASLWGTMMFMTLCLGRIRKPRRFCQRH